MKLLRAVRYVGRHRQGPFHGRGGRGKSVHINHQNRFSDLIWLQPMLWDAKSGLASLCRILAGEFSTLSKVPLELTLEHVPEQTLVAGHRLR